MNYETMAYYLFSSILQADAAIIGFGIVFVVYKLQSLENRSQMSLHLLESLGHYNSIIAPLVKNIFESDEPRIKGGALLKYMNHPHYKELELLVTIPIRIEIIKTNAFNSLRYISIHMFVCACCFFPLPILKSLLNNIPMLVLCFIILLYFGLVLLKVEKTAINTISKSNEFELKLLSPQIYDIAHG
jgi:hypothetical protein